MHYENPCKVQIFLAPDKIQAQNMFTYNVCKPKAKFWFWKKNENQIQEFVSAILIS